jgi:hypothetical protein
LGKKEERGKMKDFVKQDTKERERITWQGFISRTACYSAWLLTGDVITQVCSSAMLLETPPQRMMKPPEWVS